MPANRGYTQTDHLDKESEVSNHWDFGYLRFETDMSRPLETIILFSRGGHGFWMEMNMGDGKPHESAVWGISHLGDSVSCFHWHAK